MNADLSSITDQVAALKGETVTPSLANSVTVHCLVRSIRYHDGFARQPRAANDYPRSQRARHNEQYGTLDVLGPSGKKLYGLDYESILIVLTTLSFLPQLHKLIASSDSSGISPYYILSNLLLATNHFTIYLAFCVNDTSGGGVVVHNPPSTADFLNLTQVFVVWLLFSLVFVLTLTYLPSDDRPAKCPVVSIYITFLLISLIPQVYDIIAGFNGLAHSDREWLLVFFVAGHLAIVNPVLTILAIVSARIQVCKIKQGTAVTAFSTPGLVAQIITFAVVAVSWIWRVLYGDAPRFVENAPLDWYAKFGWPVVGNAVFANVHFVILWVIARRGRGGTDSVQGSEGETEPLLS